MLDPTEAAFLRGVAAEGDSDTGRLAYADWLDERGHSDRAEFVRVQCELTKKKLAKKRQLELRQRERALLNEHRWAWCQALEVPVEDVWFERGLVSRVRLPNWDARILDPQFATLTELDLSDVKLGDANLTAFAKGAQFPVLRTLILSDTGIKTPGATALADAAGLPSLDTLYIFGNTVTHAADNALYASPHFKLKTIDAGDREDGYCMSAGETDVARRTWLRKQLLKVATKYFDKYPPLQTIALCVAQYWADEADDAVHGTLVVSELLEPILKGVEWSHDDEEGKVKDPNLPTLRIKPKYGEGSSSAVSLWDSGAHWDSNNAAIPLWAAFAPEGGSQEYTTLDEAYAPAVMFYRHGGYEVLPMLRPHLDGVRPEWGAED